MSTMDYGIGQATDILHHYLKVASEGHFASVDDASQELRQCVQCIVNEAVRQALAALSRGQS